VFKEGDLILKKISLVSREYQSKWTLNYEGPYVVKKAFFEGALILTNMDVEDLHRLVNSNVVKKILCLMYFFYKLIKIKV
jgi:hypothetical protein